MEGREHARGRPDPHVWLSPPLVERQARRMAEALIRVDPQGAAVYRQRLRRFEKRLRALHGELAATLAPVRGARFLVFHPSWGYFADAYGLRQVPVEVDGKPPRARTLAHLVRWAREAGVHVLVVSPRLRRGTVDMLAREFEARVVTADPVAEDWEGELRRFARALAAALQAGAETGR
jgi:zinc transport system substrate-binding protein